MANRNDGPTAAGIPASALVGYFLLTFGITWGVIGSYVFLPDRTSALFGEISGSHPLFFLATWAPAIAGVVLVIAFGGLKDLRAFLSRLLIWQISAGWAAFTILGIPLVFVAGSLIKGGPVVAPAAFEDTGALLALMFIMLFLGPVEELGWRGVLQPLLQRRLAPIWAGALVGVIWGIWHLPAFFLSSTVFGGWDFLPFFVGNVVLAVLVTPILNGTRGSLFWPMLFHWQLINPFWPDAQPFDTWILVGVAIVVVWWNRETLFTRKYAVTEVIPAWDAEIPRTVG